MPDDKEMYLIMARASEEAINVLIAAQRKCEELYVQDVPASPDFLHLLHTTQKNNGKRQNRSDDVPE